MPMCASTWLGLLLCGVPSTVVAVEPEAAEDWICISPLVVAWSEAPAALIETPPTSPDTRPRPLWCAEGVGEDDPSCALSFPSIPPSRQAPVVRVPNTLLLSSSSFGPSRLECLADVVWRTCGAERRGYPPDIDRPPIRR